MAVFNANNKHRGFTIVELLVVVVVIGILAAITLLSFGSVSQSAVLASLKSDLINASNQIRMYYAENESYPTSNNCPNPGANEICLKNSQGSTFTYQYSNSFNPKVFALYASRNDIYFRITSNSTPIQVARTCPLNFIIVPGSATYGTTNFCIMKYEARQADSTTPISKADGLPWTNITQTNAINFAQNVLGCTGCRLATEKEWMTIAQNVLNNPENWSSGIVGSGYIYRGHSDGVPDNSLESDINDSNGYMGTQNNSGNQKRTLKLSNGEVIWDFSGNIYDWTLTQTNGGQPGVIGGGWDWRQWTTTMSHGNLPLNPFPDGTEITNAGNWDSTNCIGQLYSSADDVSIRGFLHGGSYNDNSGAGVLSLDIAFTPNNSSERVGFRVVEP